MDENWKGFADTLRKNILDKNRSFCEHVSMQLRVLHIFSFAFLFISLLAQGLVFAEQSLKDILNKEYRQGKDISLVAKNAIQSGMNAKEVTKACIELSHDACVVVSSAIEAKGNLEQIITGAVEAGATADVCSRCAMNAGADSKEIARILETGVGYSVAGGGGLTPIDISLPGGNRSGGVLSSSHFK